MVCLQKTFDIPGQTFMKQLNNGGRLILTVIQVSWSTNNLKILSKVSFVIKAIFFNN